MQHQPALPVSTQIVILAPVTGPGGEPVVPAGAVGVIVAQLDERSYRIRFPGGDEAIVQREDITVRAHLSIFAHLLAARPPGGYRGRRHPRPHGTAARSSAGGADNGAVGGPGGPHQW